MLQNTTCCVMARARIRTGHGMAYGNWDPTSSAPVSLSLSSRCTASTLQHQRVCTSQPAATPSVQTVCDELPYGHRQ
jgi:hypothetical protein